MGIININSNSFYKESRFTNSAAIEKRIHSMIEDGADIIDLGACSTRPGSTPITAEEEWDLLKDALNVIKKNFTAYNIRFSIDTFRSEIVKRAYGEIGDFIVNDISAGEDDTNMLKLVGELKLNYIAMHKRGTPENMQELTNYPKGVVNEVIEYFKNFEQKATEFGITNYVIDPGFGFAKNLQQNYELFNGLPAIKKELNQFCQKKRDILVGISRKSMIYKALNILPDESLEATTALNLQALLFGANILRVHDVKQAKQCCRLYELLSGNK
ncbi:MAG: dihydropteroate synthase [Bacteroidales bacterium]|nr:dihydropteroate synthase [Bacteroidales bacterium]